jgi:GT2 family glycosyltransferase
MPKEPLIAVIIVGYQSLRYLEEAFISLNQSSYKNFVVIFVDNYPQDGSSDFIRNNFPKTIVVENKTNIGFAAGNNLGANKARDIKAEYIFLLNPDTVVDKNCLKELVRHSSPQTVCQPLILLHQKNKTNLVNTSGNYVHFLGFSYVGGYKENGSKYTQIKEIPAVSGAAFFAPLKSFIDLGGLDEDFFAYHEDTDLSWRMRLLGHRLILVPTAKVWHKYSFSKHKRKFFFAERNRLLFVFKCYSWRSLLLIAPLGILSELAMCGFSIFGGWFGQKIKSYGSLLRQLGRTWEKRRQIQTIRAVSDYKMKNFWSSQLNFEEVKIPGVNTFNLILLVYKKFISIFI